MTRFVLAPDHANRTALVIAAHVQFSGGNVMGLANQMRIDFIGKGDAKTIVAHPGDKAIHPANIAQFQRDRFAHLRAQIPLGHQPGGGNIAHIDSLLDIALG